MKLFIVISALVAFALAEEFYHTGNDHLDVDKVMQDPIVVKRYIDCYLDQAPCDPLANSYKVIMHDSLVHSCIRCSPSQKHMWFRFLWILQHHYPVEYAAYKARYDPDGVLIPALIKVISSF